MNTKILETALNGLNVQYHKHDLSGNTLYFCRLCNGLSFDIMTHSDGSVRLWRFICSNVPSDRAGLHFTYSNPTYPGIVFGFEVTSEYDLSFYAEQAVDVLKADTERSIAEQLSIFLGLITRLNLRCKQQGLSGL